MTDFFEVFTIWQGWIYLFILSILEIVLGIDNIIFISIVTDKLEEGKKRVARNLGLSIALVFRLLLLSLISLLMTLTTSLFTVFDSDISGQSIILIGGGLFLIYKSVSEMNKSMNNDPEENKKTKSTLSQVITQIVLIDLIFSFDSIISAVGMTNGIHEETGRNPMAIIVIAIIISMVVMMLFSRQISEFISSNPTIKMIALSFLVAVGVLLIAEGFGQEFPKGYIYFALAYALVVEMLNIRMRKNKNGQKNS
jgi:predicted tellurium resistance membrane protein TerC